LLANVFTVPIRFWLLTGVRSATDSTASLPTQGSPKGPTGDRIVDH
jgi:hypothetical protein